MVPAMVSSGESIADSLPHRGFGRLDRRRIVATLLCRLKRGLTSIIKKRIVHLTNFFLESVLLGQRTDPGNRNVQKN